jgi:hypothetical protein
LSDKKENLHKSIDILTGVLAGYDDPEKTSADQMPAHLLDRLRTKLLVMPKSPARAAQTGWAWNFSLKVRDFRAAGIQLKRSKTSSLTDVSFDDRFPGYLYLPPIVVDESTGPIFMNLTAYEMCPDFDNDFGVTSYVYFLRSLINHPDDVKELTKAHILDNFLDNEEVAKLFNDIATDLVPNPEIYGYVKMNIQKCYNNNIYHILIKLKTWIAEVIYDHFSSPWAIVGLLAASSALVLTAIQTWYTVYPPPSP